VRNVVEILSSCNNEIFYTWWNTVPAFVRVSLTEKCLSSLLGSATTATTVVVSTILTISAFTLTVHPTSTLPPNPIRLVTRPITVALQLFKVNRDLTCLFAPLRTA
jgi:hypothetical protein